MTDVVDSRTRSRMMANIRGKDTRPELMLRRYLHSKGFRYRLHPKALPGRPDIVLSKHRAAIFVHGCFWHRHRACRYATTPSTRKEFWQQKFDANVKRDARKWNELRQLGWRVATVWECGLRKNEIEGTLPAVADWLLSDAETFEIPLTTTSSQPQRA